MSSSLAMRIIYTGILVIQHNGFYINGQCAPDDSTVINGGRGVIVSPNYPNTYPTKAKCKWEFKQQPEVENYIVLQIVDIRLYYVGPLFRKQCTASLEIGNGVLFGKEVVDCDSDELSCYVYRSESESCKEIQVNGDFSSCVSKEMDSATVTVIFESGEDTNNDTRGFNMTYDYIQCGPGTSPSRTSTITEVETTEVATSIVDVGTENIMTTTEYSTQDWPSNTNATTKGQSTYLPDETATTIHKTSITGKTAHNTVKSTWKSTTVKPPQSQNHVIAIVLAVLVIVLIIVGIAILIVLQRKRSAPKTAEEFFGVNHDKKLPNNGSPNYDVLYKPPDNYNEYEEIQLDGEKMNGEQTYSEIKQSEIEISKKQSEEDSYDHLNETLNGRPSSSIDSKFQPPEGAKPQENDYEQVIKFEHAGAQDNVSTSPDDVKVTSSAIYDDVYEPSYEEQSVVSGHKEKDFSSPEDEEIRQNEEGQRSAPKLSDEEPQTEVQTTADSYTVVVPKSQRSGRN